MGFLDNITDKISQGSAKVAEKAKEVSELAQLSAVVEKEKVVQEKLYLELGKAMYNQYKDVAAEKLPEVAGKIDDSVKKMEEAKAAIKAKKGNPVCPGCGKEVTKETRFCPACGAVIPETAEAEETVSSEATEEETTETYTEE